MQPNAVKVPPVPANGCSSHAAALAFCLGYGDGCQDQDSEQGIRPKGRDIYGEKPALESRPPILHARDPKRQAKTQRDPHIIDQKRKRDNRPCKKQYSCSVKTLPTVRLLSMHYEGLTKARVRNHPTADRSIPVGSPVR